MNYTIIWFTSVRAGQPPYRVHKVGCKDIAKEFRNNGQQSHTVHGWNNVAGFLGAWKNEPGVIAPCVKKDDTMIADLDLKEGDQIILPEDEDDDGETIRAQRATVLSVDRKHQVAMVEIHPKDRLEDDADGLTEISLADASEYEKWTPKKKGGR